MGQGSMGQGSMGRGPTAGTDFRESCAGVAQATNVMPMALVMGDTTALDQVRRTLDTRLSAEGASPDMSNNTLAFFDKGIAAAREARIGQAALHGYGPSSRSSTSQSSGAVGGGPSSTGSTSGTPKSGTTQGTTKTTPSKQAATRPGAEEIRAHRALGDLYQFGRNLGATQTGTEAQAVAWIIAVDRFEGVSELPTQQKSLAAEPLFAVMYNVPAPAPTAGRTTPSWNEYLSAAARSASATSPTGRAVGGGPSGTDEKSNMRQVARSSEERLQLLGQQLPASSALRPEIDQKVAELRKVEAMTSQPSGTTPSQPHGTKKQPTQPSQQQQQNQKQQ
jgi:hypothetical protein